MESTFKYVFALIVGAMFIIFFTRFAMNYATSSQKEEATIFVRYFDEQLSILSNSQDAVQEYNLGTKTEITISKGKIGSGTGLPKSMSKIVYSPGKMTGTKVIMWTKKWEFPYAIDNFFYLTNANYKYVIVYDGTSKEFAEILADPDEEIPKPFGVKAFEVNDFLSKKGQLAPSYSGFTKARLAYLSDNPKSDKITKLKASMGNADVVVIKRTDTEDEDWKAGEVQFGEDKGIYLGLPMLLGAVFADNFENYDYNFKAAMARMGEVTAVYGKKADYMTQQLSGCQDIYERMAGLLDSYAKLKGEKAGLQEFISKMDEMEEMNLKEFGTECPGVF